LLLFGLAIQTGEKRRDEKDAIADTIAELVRGNGIVLSLGSSRRCGQSKASRLSFSNFRKARFAGTDENAKQPLINRYWKIRKQYNTH
jgi:hypothetical protein